LKVEWLSFGLRRFCPPSVNKCTLPEEVKRLGVYESGGMMWIGIAHYNTAAEVDRLLDVVRQL